MMYECLHCGQVFCQPDKKEVTESYGGSDSGNSICMPQREEIEVCPHCLSDDIKQLKCDVCGNDLHQYEYIKAEDGNRICDTCLPDYFVDNYGGEYE